MSAKTRFIKSSFLVSLLLFFLCLQQLSAANVLGRPRKMFLIKTEHFDIIFSTQSEETALLLAQKADLLYSKAAEALESKANLHMPVIISPDSDVFSVTYTPSPYNRIIIFDSPADYETAVFDDTMQSLFYREIYKALAQSIRSPFNQFVAKWIAGESYQPAALFNLPYSFVEGIAYIAESQESGEGRLNDGYFLQILAQAKLEGKFPKWSQVTTVRDIYPGEELALAAGAGFSAFLMSEYGVEKYAELWQNSGKLNPLLTQGVFWDTFGKTLYELWNEFEEAVPLPAGLAELESYELEGKLVFPKDKEANYEHILLTDYGTVWYDRIRHEVDIFDENNLLKIRQLLFLADNVERLSLSPDGRYMAVSHTQGRTMEDLSSCSVWIYDLRDRKFLGAKYGLRDGAIVRTAEGRLAVAGLNVKNLHAKLEVFTLPLGDIKNEKIELIYGREFARNQTPFSPVYSGDGIAAYILADGKERYLCRQSFDSRLEQKWLVERADGEAAPTPLKIQRLSWNPDRSGRPPYYTFAATLPAENSFTRAGFIYLTEDFEPQSVELTAADISGGINFPVVSSTGALIYSAHKYSQNQLRSVALSALPREEVALRDVGDSDGDDGSADLGDVAAAGDSGDLGNPDALSDSAAPGDVTDLGTLNDYSVRRYLPFKYMADFSVTPFFPMKIMDFSDGNLYWPGLGLTVESQSDPCMNTKALLSAGWTYLPMDFTWTSNIPSSYLAKIRTESLNLSKDKSAAFFIENSSTPVYLRAGTIFNCNLEGAYNFRVIADGQWSLPVGIALRRLLFDLQASYNVSTDYYDQTQRNIRPSLDNWPKFKDAYEMYELSAKIEYSNIHQYGYSTFEKRGLTIGTRAYAMWDMCEVRLLQEARKQQEAEEKAKKEAASSGNEDENKTKSPEETLTNAQKKNLVKESISDITQLNAGFFATIAIPRLNPLTMYDGWVLSMPAELSAEFVNKAGTALDSSFQVLLIGREIHNSVIPAFLYSRRAGLWFGYNLALVYDTAEVRLPDIRHENYLAEVFQGVSCTQAIYAVLNLDLNITTGKLSSVPINTTLTGTWFPENHGYDISLDVRLHL